MRREETVDSRLRGNDGPFLLRASRRNQWIPACAGMTAHSPSTRAGEADSGGTGRSACATASRARERDAPATAGETPALQTYGDVKSPLPPPLPLDAPARGQLAW